jgi:molybdopterin converting factor small subunit
VLKDWLGTAAATVEFPEGATVGELLAWLSESRPAGQISSALRGIAVSVNAEFATASQPLREGDEVGLLPPVSGGTARTRALRVRRTSLRILPR